MGKKDSKKPRGRMSSYAFFVQETRAQQSKNNPNEQVVFAEFSKACSKAWKDMHGDDKKVFLDMAERDKIRYDREMAGYKPPKGETKGNNKRRRRRKDPDAPKRNLSAFFIFSGEMRGGVKQVHPEWSVGDIAKELSVRWRGMSSAEKEKYEKGAERDKERYMTEMAAFKAKQKHAPKPKRRDSTSSSSSSSSDDSSSDSDSDEE